jgi:hypothetical protein
MERTSNDVDGYLEALEGSQGEDVRRLDQAVGELMAGQPRFLYEGRFWGGTDQRIVGYGIMDYTNRSGDDVEWFIVGLAAQKDHISMYVNAVKDGAYLLSEYAKKLGKAKVGSASISFATLDEVDLDNLLELVERAGDTATA